MPFDRCVAGLPMGEQLATIAYYLEQGGGAGASAIAVEAATFAPNYSLDEEVPLAVDKDSGGLLCHTRKLTAADDTVSLGGVQRTVSLDVEGAGTGTVTAGAKVVQFITSSDFEGMILGVAGSINPSESMGWSAPAGDTLPAMAWSVTTGTLRIRTIR